MDKDISKLENQLTSLSNTPMSGKKKPILGRDIVEKIIREIQSEWDSMKINFKDEYERMVGEKIENLEHKAIAINKEMEIEK